MEDQAQFTFTGPWGDISYSYAPGNGTLMVPTFGTATHMTSNRPFATVTVETEDAATEPAQEIAWEAVLALEGVPTDDNGPTRRILLPDSMTWRELPFALLAMTEIVGEGHMGQEVAGRIDEIWRQARPDLGDNIFAIMGRGVFDTGEFGQEIARMVADKTLRGVSIDPGAVKWAFVLADTLEPIAETDMDVDSYMDGAYYAAMTEGKILGATVCPMQAIEGATISILAASAAEVRIETSDIWLVDAEPLTACAAGPLKPPVDWFAEPNLRQLTPLTVTDGGQVYGHLSTWECHVGYEDRCMKARPSHDGYARFHSAKLVTAEGQHIKVGRIQVKPHASRKMTIDETVAYYSDPKTVAAFVCIWDDGFGIKCAGTTKSDASPELLRDFYANPPSGEWRRGELMGFSCVPLPGLPVVAPEAYLVASAGGEAEIEMLILPGVTEDDIVEPDEVDVLVAAAALQGDEALAALIAE